MANKPRMMLMCPVIFSYSVCLPYAGSIERRGELRTKQALLTASLFHWDLLIYPGLRLIFSSPPRATWSSSLTIKMVFELTTKT